MIPRWDRINPQEVYGYPETPHYPGYMTVPIAEAGQVLARILAEKYPHLVSTKNIREFPGLREYDGTIEMALVPGSSISFAFGISESITYIRHSYIRDEDIPVTLSCRYGNVQPTHRGDFNRLLVTFPFIVLRRDSDEAEAFEDYLEEVPLRMVPKEKDYTEFEFT